MLVAPRPISKHNEPETATGPVWRELLKLISAHITLMIKFPLLFNFMVEATVAALMFVAPQTFNQPLTPEVLGLSRAMGVGALVIALFTLRIYFSSDNALVRLGLWTVVLYHFGIGTVQLFHPMGGDLHPLAPVMFHGCIALWGLISLQLLKKWR